MITAQTARQLAGPTVEEKVEALGRRIHELAKEGRRQLRCGYDYDQDQELWINGGYTKTEQWLSAVNILKNHGFEVEFYYNEGQFVDMYTRITW